jgi:hypothetical protein
MTDKLDPKLHAIIDRAAGRIRKPEREKFRAYVLDIVRGMNDPTPTMMRHACGDGFLRYGRKL